MSDLIKETERTKYETVWADRGYAAQADGDPVVDLAFNIMGCVHGESLIDWGCGCGRPAAKFQRLGLSVVGFDIAYNCMDKDVGVPLLIRCLWDLPNDGVAADYAFCTDVLEHIPPEKLGLVIANMRARTHKAAFIQVCTVLDTSGPKMSPPQRLHLSVFPTSVWEQKLLAVWPAVKPVKAGGKVRSAFLCR